MREKQAAASVGQCELMFIYDKFFSQYGQTISQLLITKTITANETPRVNVINTMETLLQYGVIPIVNENDSIAFDEIAYGDNDTLSAITAYLVHADLLVILSDIDGLYDKNPSKYDDAKTNSRRRWYQFAYTFYGRGCFQQCWNGWNDYQITCGTICK